MAPSSSDGNTLRSCHGLRTPADTARTAWTSGELRRNSGVRNATTTLPENKLAEFIGTAAELGKEHSALFKDGCPVEQIIHEYAYNRSE
jgi:hypothetical protein